MQQPTLAIGWCAFLTLALPHCGPAKSDATPQPRASHQASEQGACVNLHEPTRCEAFEAAAFAEAYTTFFYASPAELEAAYPYGASPEAGPEGRAPHVDQAAFERASEIERGLSHLPCFGVTEEELGPLGSALGLPRPPDRKLSPDVYAHLTERRTGTRPEPSEIPGSVPGSYLRLAWVIPDTCTAVYRIPTDFVARLRAESNPAALAQRWVQAIEAAGSREYFLPYEEATAEPIRRDVGRWTNVAAALTRFASLAPCSNRDLYVEVTYDC